MEQLDFCCKIIFTQVSLILEANNLIKANFPFQPISQMSGGSVLSILHSGETTKWTKDSRSSRINTQVNTTNTIKALGKMSNSRPFPSRPATTQVNEGDMKITTPRRMLWSPPSARRSKSWNSSISPCWPTSKVSVRLPTRSSHNPTACILRTKKCWAL